MKIIGEKSLASKVKLLLDLIFFGGIIIFFSLPFSLKWYLEITYTSVGKGIYYFLLALLAITGIFALLIVNEIRRIFVTLDKKDPFIMENVVSLKKMSAYSFIIALCYISKIIFFNSFATIILIMVFIIAGFFTVIMAEVFKQAVEAKQENDFTI